MPNKFQRYKRGSIVMIDFSPSIGSELRGKHFGIVLTKKDTPNNGVLTVVPLTSKNKPFYLPLCNVLGPELNQFFKDQLVVFKSQAGEIARIDEAIQIMNNISDVIDLLKIYRSKDVDSYAMVQNITTVSKLRVQKPINKFDPIQKIKVPSDVLDKIEKEMIKLFLNNPKSAFDTETTK